MIKTDIDFAKLAIASYDNPSCVDAREFQSDLKRFNILNRYLSKTEELDSLGARKIINSVIILYNIFGQSTDDLLDYKIPSEHRKKLNSILLVINRLNNTNDAQIDSDFLEMLRCQL